MASVRFLHAVLILCCLLVGGCGQMRTSAAARPRAEVPELLRGVRRVVFLGNSITYAGDYVTDVEMALLARGVDVEVLNLGLPSETATRLTEAENAEHLRRYGFGRPFLGERLERVLAETRPDLVFASYGMNDGSSLAAGEESVRRFGEAMEELRAVAKRYGVKEVVHLTPPVYDAAANPDAADYDPMLARFSEWLVARRRDGWNVVDVHTPMRRALDERRRSEPTFAFARDGVHPGREGHALMAREILAFLGDTSTTGADEELRSLVHQRMGVLRDAWLTRTRHTRPGMQPGLPLEEARARAAELTTQIQARRATP
jgi:lysophospholipase L1-like esterase